MLCDHQLVTEHLFDYIDGKLSPTVRQQVEQAMDQCEACQASYHQAVNLHQSAHQWQEQPVPEWHRTEYAARPRQRSNNWLSWSALATSTLAILMVVFQVQVSSSDQGMQIAFGGNSNTQVEALVEQKLAEYKQQQDLLIDARFVSAADKQETAAKLLVADLMEKTRDERREDLNFLVTGIQTQRYEDRQNYDKRLAMLADNQIENGQYINKLIQSANLIKGER